MKKKEIIQRLPPTDPLPDPAPFPPPLASQAMTDDPENGPQGGQTSAGRRVLGNFLLGILLGAGELMLAIHTKLLDWPIAFISLLFGLFLLVGALGLRRPGNGAFLLLAMVTHSLVVMGGYLYQRLISLRLPLVPWNFFYYFLLYVWPGILAVLCVILLRRLLKPEPPRTLAPLRRQVKFHRRVQQRSEQTGRGTARPLRLEQELRLRAARRKDK